jgi:hypothetical protein
MKAIVVLLALLAAAKVGYGEYLFRSGTRDALVGAYRAHAAEACHNDARQLNMGLAQQEWANPRAVSLVIGKSSIDVYPWQVDNALWSARYRNPYLVLTVGTKHGGGVFCEYDVVNASASVSRL